MIKTEPEKTLRVEVNNHEIDDIINTKIEEVAKNHGISVKICLLEIIGLERLKQPQITDNAPQTRLIPLPKWNEYHPHPTVAGMRMKVFYSDINGFDEYEVVHRDGKRVLIDEQAYFHWQRRGSEKAA